VVTGKRPSTRGTVLIAGTANVIVGAIKLAAGIMVGSSGMLAEAAHSAADTLNQALLLLSVHRGERAADERHPFGYGQERYFWSLLAAFGSFIAGAGFSVSEGVLALRRGGGESPLIAYVALAVSGVAEGTSLVRAIVQLRGAGRRGNVEVLDHVRRSPDTTVKAALFEDSAAMAGLGFAALGLVLRQVTGSPAWDGAASIVIGGLLVVVAVRLGLDSRDYLIGRTAGPEELAVIRAEIGNAPGVHALLDLRTMHLGPDRLVVAAKVAFDDDISADQAEDVADEVDRRLASRLSQIPHVFLDPTQISGSAFSMMTFTAGRFDGRSGGNPSEQRGQCAARADHRSAGDQREHTVRAGQAEHQPRNVVSDHAALETAGHGERHRQPGTGSARTRGRPPPRPDRHGTARSRPGSARQATRSPRLGLGCLTGQSSRPPRHRPANPTRFVPRALR
jgi:cation diffusion facilitator family transporter